MTIFTVAASDILGENYKLTKIECTDYNPNIDDSITLTIILTDVYDDPIDGENVTVTASEGTFTQLNGSDITAASSVTGTTNSSGQFTLTYSCSEWGLITFSANNSNSTQIKVTGIKRVENSSDYEVYVNESTVTFIIHLESPVTIPTSFTAFGGGAKISETKYRPQYTHAFVAYNNNDIALALKGDGTVERRSLTGSQISSTVYAAVSFPRRNL